MKYIALSLNLATLTLFLWGAFGVVSIQFSRIPQMPGVRFEVKKLDEKDLQDQIDVVQSMKIVNAAAGKPSPERVQDFSLLSQAESRGTGTSDSQMPERHVAVVIDGDGDASAVLDGSVVRSGAELIGGGRLKSIHGDRVMTSEKNGKQTLQLPIRRMRIGTLYWPQPSSNITPLDAAKNKWQVVPNLQGVTK